MPTGALSHLSLVAESALWCVVLLRLNLVTERIIQRLVALHLAIPVTLNASLGPYAFPPGLVGNVTPRPRGLNWLVISVA